MKIILATGNKHKKEEISKALPNWEIYSLSDIGYFDEIVEDGKTLTENALIKARTVYEKYKKPVIADDTGLLVDALDGEPGVYSARYAEIHGMGKTDEDNIDYLLSRMKNIPEENRNAHFETIIVYIDKNGKEYILKGVCQGRILTERRGVGGFGYDSVFFSNDLGMSFSEAGIEKKNSVSHRGKAVAQLIELIGEENADQ